MVDRRHFYCVPDSWSPQQQFRYRGMMALRRRRLIKPEALDTPCTLCGYRIHTNDRNSFCRRGYGPQHLSIFLPVGCAQLNPTPDLAYMRLDTFLMFVMRKARNKAGWRSELSTTYTDTSKLTTRSRSRFCDSKLRVAKVAYAAAVVRVAPFSWTKACWSYRR